jgi:hypothetical protein
MVSRYRSSTISVAEYRRLKAQSTAFEVARQQFDPDRFNEQSLGHVVTYGRDEDRRIAKLAGLSRPITQKEYSAIEYYEHEHNPAAPRVLQGRVSADNIWFVGDKGTLLRVDFVPVKGGFEYHAGLLIPITYERYRYSGKGEGPGMPLILRRWSA